MACACLKKAAVGRLLAFAAAQQLGVMLAGTVWHSSCVVLCGRVLAVVACKEECSRVWQHRCCSAMLQLCTEVACAFVHMHLSTCASHEWITLAAAAMHPCIACAAVCSPANGICYGWQVLSLLVSAMLLPAKRTQSQLIRLASYVLQVPLAATLGLY
jgi:hypothetical protein